MIESNVLASSSHASSIQEAQALVRQCAEPRPVGDSIKSAINRAARRLGFGPSRTRKLWYGNAQRIDAHEMDHLRARAVSAKFDGAVASLSGLRANLSENGSRDSVEILVGIDAALRTLGHSTRVSASAMRASSK
jgi:hypothetical protein